MSYKDFNVDTLLDKIWIDVFERTKKSNYVHSKEKVKYESELILFILSLFPSETLNVDYFLSESAVCITFWKNDFSVGRAARSTSSTSSINKGFFGVNKIFGLINMRAIIPKHLSDKFDSFTVDSFQTSFNSDATIKVSDVIKNDSLMREIFQIVYMRYISEFNIDISTFDLDKIEKLNLLNIWL